MSPLQVLDKSLESPLCMTVLISETGQVRPLITMLLFVTIILVAASFQ